ncbi:DNA repair ATPase [Thalassoglobus sp.]|uniref:DNA repair ATPase n=1 Tax=Thalassoglobus sp. TaxID=2795869 RepID=UPI003AA8B52F
MPESPQQPEVATQLESGTYEILRNRLRSHGEELRNRLDQLNENRKDVFGSIDLKLLNTERITTEHNCVPRDMVAVGDQFLFGYNVQFGLRTERHVADVFAVYSFDNETKTFSPESLDLLQNAAFEKDFQDVYRYYKSATFAKFFKRGVHLYMVFQVGKSSTDIKSFKWLVEGNTLRYLDNRSDHEVRFPAQHEFEWQKTTRDMQRHGEHPHISIDDRIFVETVGGDLTIKVENNTESGAGIYEEPVENADQTLDDADIFYALVGHTILLKIRPYQEQDWRYIVFNEKIQKASRVDSIADACVLLPDDHGLIFSNGYYLQSGERKTFDTSIQGLIFDRRVSSPNGEDTLYVFYQPVQGVYVLLGYNLIEQIVDTPVICNGFTMFRGGETILFKSHGEPQKHHAVQVWQTPYVGEDYETFENTDSYLYKIGNRDIVRGMAECHEILNLIEKEDSYSDLYVDLVKYAGDILDSYFWINNAEAANLGEPLQQIKVAATSAVDEFEKVVRVRQNTREQTQQVAGETRELLNEVGRRRFDNIDSFVKSLAGLRRVRGEIIGLRDLRYADTELIEQLETEVAEQADQLSHRCVEFLLNDDALQPYADAVAIEQAGIDDLSKVADAKQVEEKIAESSHELEMLIEIVSNLKIDDATQRTTIIDNISGIFSHVNAARASLKRKIQELASVEGSAEFSSQLKLMNQSVVNYLDVCDSPEKCEEYLTKLMVQLEELEGKFAEFDEFIVQLADKREEVAGAFGSRRMQLVEKRNKRANALADAADRILKGVKNRIESFQEISDIHGYFASDLMIDKVRNIVSDLEGLGDSVKVDDIQSRLKTIREDAVRQLKDKKELYEDGDHVIRFGNHRFSVNTQVLDLTTVLRDGELNYHLTGTDFYEPVNSEELNSTQSVWAMEVVSENKEVYRAEFLAYTMLQAARNGEWNPHEDQSSPQSAKQLMSEVDLLSEVQKFMGPRYQEGYSKGVHDQDAAKILHALLEIDSACGLLRYSSRSRVLANLFWWNFGDSKSKKLKEQVLTGFGTISQLFPGTDQQQEYLADLRKMLFEFIEESEFYGASEVPSGLVHEAAEYLFDELTDDSRSVRGNQFVVSQTAANLFREFHDHLKRLDAQERFTKAMKAVQRDTLASFELARDWTTAFLLNYGNGEEVFDYREEIAKLIMDGQVDERAVVAAQMERKLTKMIGAHSVIQSGNYELRFNHFLDRLSTFERETIPRFKRYHELKSQLVDEHRDAMKLTEFQPRVLTSFVRNQLIDQVYLPLVGDNLAKQIGTTGEGKRTDRQGLLLLISPPGYGKTTLMEYIANRLGIIFMKVNGPALGHEVTSLDPAAAPNAGAREEIEKLNLAFEMGDNVLIYLDDIQHCHTEFLQKFISLCDAQRKIEGVYKGKTQTYDFRGKKVAVVMAGNPYTESGEKFQIPDMLSNRADIYNLGEIIGDTADAFELSYIENALTSNPVLGKLASRSQKDVYAVVKMAERTLRGDAAPSEGIDFEANYSMEELNDFVDTMMKLMRVRDVVLRVNQEYITSAAQHDDYRTEPPFLLQGSYRNMNRIAEKVLPVMNGDEIESLIQSSYQNDAQTLTSGTEANLLKFKELTGSLTANEQERWDDIKRTFKQNIKMRGIGSDDKVGQVIATLTTFSDGLDSIRKAVNEGATTLSAKSDSQSDAPDEDVLREELRAMSLQLAEGLEQIARLSNRPINVSVPPLEMKWPETFPITTAPDSASSEEPSRTSDRNRPKIVDEEEGENAESDDRITIVNRLPKTVYGVLESQFELMQQWLKPLTELSMSQHEQISNLRPKIEECLSNYQRLLNKLEAAQDRD